MHRSELNGLYYLANQDDLSSFLEHGLFARNKGRRSTHDMSDPEVQARRAAIKVGDTGKNLHAFANVFFNPRNSMMYRLKKERGAHALCLIRFSSAILDLPGVWVSDRNASTDKVRFFKALRLGDVPSHQIFHDGFWEGNVDLKQAMQAEVLVPDHIPPRFIDRVILPGRTYIDVPEGVDVYSHPFLFFGHGGEVQETPRQPDVSGDIFGEFSKVFSGLTGQSKTTSSSSGGGGSGCMVVMAILAILPFLYALLT